MGIDASSTTIGLALIEADGQKVKLIDSRYIKPPKKGSIFSRLDSVKDSIEEVIDEWKPDTIAIEDIIQFMAGGSGAKTIILLAIVNRFVGYTCYKKLNREPTYMNVMTIRHALKLTKKLPAKEEMPELVAHHLKTDYPWLTRINRKKETVVMEESYDVADAMAVALAFTKKFL